MADRATCRRGILLVEVPGLSGKLYQPGTEVKIVSGYPGSSSVDGFIDGDWVPLAWWEFSEGIPESR